MFDMRKGKKWEISKMLKRKKHWIQHGHIRLRKTLKDRGGASQASHDNFRFLQFTQVKISKTSGEMVRRKMGLFVNYWNKEVA